LVTEVSRLIPCNASDSRSPSILWFISQIGSRCVSRESPHDLPPTPILRVRRQANAHQSGPANNAWSRGRGTGAPRTWNAHSRWNGLARCSTTRRTDRTIRPPIFSSLRRIVPTWAEASSVPANPSRRNVSRSTYAAADRSTRNWFARNAWQLVRSAKRPNGCSLIRFSASPLAAHPERHGNSHSLWYIKWGRVTPVGSVHPIQQMQPLQPDGRCPCGGNTGNRLR